MGNLEEILSKILDLIEKKGYLKDYEIVYYLKNKFDPIDLHKAISLGLEKGYLKKYGANIGFSKEEVMDDHEKRIRFRELLFKMYKI